METPIPPAPETAPSPARARLKILGIGNAGVALVTQLRAGEFLPAQFVAVDAAPAVTGEMEQIEIPRSLLGGHGSLCSEPGKVELEGQFKAVESGCANCDTLFLLAGLGGRTGSWISAAAARAARAAGAQVFAFVTLPFDCEGSVRFSQARQALDRLRPHCDFLFIQPHQDACGQLAESLSLTEAYAASNRRLLAGLRHVAEALAGSTIMGMGFGDLCVMLRERGAQVMFAAGNSNGANRAGAVIEELLAHPQLGGGKALAGAETVAVSLVGGQDLRMADVNKVMQELGQHWQGASHLLSASVTTAAHGPLSALLLLVTPERAAARLGATLRGQLGAEGDESSGSAPAGATASLSSPRFHPAAEETGPVTSPRTRNARTRSQQSRLKQGQLQLDLANKGRFEKSEPTIHKGEDLDVPTFIRRGVVLN